MRLNGCENNDPAIFLEYFASHGHSDNREQNKHRVFQVWKKQFILKFWESGECGSEGSEQLSLPEQEKQEQGGFAFWQEKNFEYMRQEQSRRSREDRSGRFAFLSRTLAIF